MSKSEKIGTALTQVSFCGMLILVPLIYQSGIYEYALLPKRLAFYACAGLASLGWLIRSDWGRTSSWISSPLLLPLSCYGALAALSFSQTTHPLDALTELTYQAVCIGLFLTAANTLPHLKPLLWTNTLVGLAIALIGIAQFHNLAFVDQGFFPMPTNGHPSATLGFRNFAAMYLICALPLSALLFLNTTSVAGQILSCLSTTLMGVFLVYTRTRGAWFGFGIALFLVVGTLTAVPFLRTVWKESIPPLLRPPQIIFLALGLALFLGLTPLSPQFRDSGLQRFDEKKTDITSTVTSAFREGGDRGRLNMWRNTLDLMMDHPLLGVGPGGWKRAYPPYDQGVMIRKNSSPVRPHNDYLWIASEYGLPGLAVYIWALVMAFAGLFRMARQSKPIWKRAAPFFAISILSILLHACFSFPKEQPQAVLYLYLLLGLIAGASSDRKPLHRFLGAAVLYLLLGLNLAASIITLQQIHFDRHYLAALLAEDRSDWPTVQSEIKKALDRGVFRSHGLVILGRALEKAGKYEASETAYKKVLSLAPHTWHAYNGLGVIYKKRGRFEEAQNAYQNALSFFPGSLNPDRVDIQNNLAALYRSMGDTSRAESIYRTVLQSYPKNPGANNNLGNIFKFRGQLDSAIVAYQKAIQADPTLVQAYFNLGNTLFSRSRHREAQAAYQNFLNRWTGDPQYTQFAREQIKACQKQISPGSP